MYYGMFFMGLQTDFWPTSQQTEQQGAGGMENRWTTVKMAKIFCAILAEARDGQCLTYHEFTSLIKTKDSHRSKS